MKMWLCWGLLIVAALAASAAEKEIDTKAKESEARIKRDLGFLASDECEGRGPTTKGIDKAADYIAGEFVVVRRDAPTFIEGNSRRKAASLIEKMTQAQKRDALAILFVNEAATAKDGDDLLDFNFHATARNDIKLPAYHVKRAVVDK